MKRTNLILDEKLLNEAVALMGVRTYSEAVNQSLSESIRLRKAQDILSYAGSGVWEGDLSKMREDETKSKRKKSGRI
ncbi:MAG: type II toxin-antitoxin system VapB family antitoxin [Bdellovibrionia bacterium]